MVRTLVAMSMQMPIAAARACIWDSDTLADEKKKNPDMVALILGTRQSAPDTNALRKRIDALKAKPHENDPAIVLVYVLYRRVRGPVATTAALIVSGPGGVARPFTATFRSPAIIP